MKKLNTKRLGRLFATSILSISLLLVSAIPVMASSDFNEKEPNNSISQANTIKLNKKVNGVTDQFENYDYYKLKITKKGELTIRGNAFQYFSNKSKLCYDISSYFAISLYDSDNNEIEVSSLLSSRGFTYGRELKISLEPGVYYINVNGYNGLNYKFSTSFSNKK